MDLLNKGINQKKLYEERIGKHFLQMCLLRIVLKTSGLASKIKCLSPRLLILYLIFVWLVLKS